MKKIGGKYYYFDIKTGYTKSGFVRSANGAVVRYFQPSNYTMAKGWLKNAKGQKWYFARDGKMYMGLKKSANIIIISIQVQELQPAVM